MERFDYNYHCMFVFFGWLVDYISLLWHVVSKYVHKLFSIKQAYFSGQQRSRILANLFKDERCQQLPAYGILEKM